MRKSRAKLRVLRWMVFFALVISLGAVLNASSCNKGGEFQRTLGSKIDAESNITRTTSEHKYVVDIEKRLYWPNKPKYVTKIPKGSRVWIYDDKSLATKSFKPGPL